MTRSDASFLDQILDRSLKLQEPNRICDGGTVLASALCNLFLREGEVLDQMLESARLLHRIQIFALEIFHEGHLDGPLLGNFADYDGNAAECGSLGRAPAPFAGDELVTRTNAPNDERLNNPAGVNGTSEFVEAFLAEMGAGLIRARVNQVNIGLKHAVRWR